MAPLLDLIHDYQQAACLCTFFVPLRPLGVDLHAGRRSDLHPIRRATATRRGSRLAWRRCPRHVVLPQPGTGARRSRQCADTYSPGGGFVTPEIKRISGSVRSISSRSSVKVFTRAVPVTPPAASFPVWIAANVWRDRLTKRLCSSATAPSRSWSSVALSRRAFSLSSPNAVTASAMASSRHLFSVRNSSVVISELLLTANSVTAWHTSP